MIRLKNLIPRKQAENADTVQYTATNCQAVIDKFTATNTSANPVLINVNLVAKGGNVGPANRVVESKSIAPKETYTFPELVGQSLDVGGFISTWASDPAALTLSASGREVT
jgi:hypothetical protein